jgi:NTP pyrophosphatase (non-canonical NTP hydrolase)
LCYLSDTDNGQNHVGFFTSRFEAVEAVEVAVAAASEVVKNAIDKALTTKVMECLTPLILNDLCTDIHTKNIKAGWWDQAENPLVVPTKLALISSEIAEALEGHRKGLKDDKLPQYDMIAVELADVLIRVFDLAGFLKIPLGTIIEAKEAFNASREDHKPETRKAQGGKKY